MARVRRAGDCRALAQAEKRGLCEEISSQTVEVRRKHRGVGCDKNVGDKNRLHQLVLALAGSDRHCPTQSDPFTHGTRWDATSERWGLELPDWAHSHPRLPGPCSASSTTCSLVGSGYGAR